jgi:indole-3-glycerol phosphate synthase
MNILEKIVARKKEEVAARKQVTSAAQLKAMPAFQRSCFSLKERLMSGKTSGIIAEYKRQSPSKGVINASADVVEVTSAYAQAAAGISVLTDADFFGGSAVDLMRARVQQIPILRKDFMIDTYQLDEAKAMGADVILLIAACLSVDEVAIMAAYAKAVGLEVLLEIHDATELKHICADVDMVGVNNRNLKTFEVSLDTSLNLIQQLPKDKPAVAESGISSVENILLLEKAGFKGFLVGENFMKTSEPGKAFLEFVEALRFAR